MKLHLLFQTVTTAPLLPLSIMPKQLKSSVELAQIFTPWTSPSRGMIANTRVLSKHLPDLACPWRVIGPT